MLDYLLDNPLQSSIHANYSMVTNFLKMADDIIRGVDRKQVTLLIPFDFSKALWSTTMCNAENLQVPLFIFTNWELILAKLCSLTMLLRSRSYARFHLRPLLFFLLLNDLPNVLLHKKYLMFTLLMTPVVHLISTFNRSWWCWSYQLRFKTCGTVAEIVQIFTENGFRRIRKQHRLFYSIASKVFSDRSLRSHMHIFFHTTQNGSW